MIIVLFLFGLVALLVVLSSIALAGVSSVSVVRSIIELIRNPSLGLISFRSLLQHRLRAGLLGAAIALVTAGLLMVTGISVGINDTLLTSATTLMSGHVNVGGFYKATASQSAPVVTAFAKVEDIVKREFPEVDYVAQRGRGWAKLVSDTGSMQAGIGGVNHHFERVHLRQLCVSLSDLPDDFDRIAAGYDAICESPDARPEPRVVLIFLFGFPIDQAALGVFHHHPALSINVISIQRKRGVRFL